MNKRKVNLLAMAVLGFTLWGCSSNKANDTENKESSVKTEKKQTQPKKKESKKKFQKETSSSSSVSSSSSSVETSQQESKTAVSSQSESTNTAKSEQSNIKPITDTNFAIAAADQAFEEVAADGDTFPSQGTDPESGPNADGSFTLKTYAGAKGLNVYTLTPLPDGQIKVHAQYGSVQGGEFQDGGTKVITFQSGH